MKIMAIIFVPLILRLRHANIFAPVIVPPNERAERWAKEEDYPFWTWFLPNPLCPPKERK